MKNFLASMLFALAAVGGLMLVLRFTTPQQPERVTYTIPKVGPDWQKAWEHAKNGGTVLLYVQAIKNEDNKPFEVYLIVGGKAHMIGNPVAGGQGCGPDIDSFNLVRDVTEVLKALPVAPDDETAVGLVPLKEQKISYLKVQLGFE